jgi:transposase
MQIDGIGYGTILTLLAETGVDLGDFPTSDHFVSWMCISPNKKITGGKVISSHTRKNKCALAYAFRQAANTIGNQKGTALSHYFHRLAFRKGRKVAIMATARKLAVTVYNMLQKGQPYKPQPLEDYQENLRAQKVKNIQRTISRLEVKAEELAFN